MINLAIVLTNERHMQKKLLLLWLLISSLLPVSGQRFILDLMERNDIRLSDAEAMAKRYFDSAGTDRGTGYVHFQRWLFERKFHVDEQGNYIEPKTEWENWSNTTPPATARTQALAWTEMGPWGWTYTSGWNPGTGRLTDVAIHPSDTTIIYVTSPGGGIWKSSNSGNTWTPLRDFVSTWFNMYAVTIDPSNINTVYAGNSSGNTMKSTNGGASWVTLGSGPSGTVRKILVHPSNPNIVFVCSSAGIHRSVNGGTNWTLVHNVQKEDIEFNPADPNIMIATGNTTVVRSTDNGLTWTTLGAAQGITNAGRSLVTVTPANPAYVYIVQANGSEFGRLYRSTDGGLSFTTTVTGSAATNTNYFGYSPSGNQTGGQAGYDMALAASPVNADEVYIAGIIVWRSVNAGVSFVAQTVWSYPNGTGYNHADVHGLRFVNNTLYSNSDGGIFKSMDRADNWTNISTGLGIRQFYRIALSQTDVNVITGGAQDNGSVARKPAGNWVDWLGADGMEGLVSPTNPNNLWGTSQNGNIYRSTNGGNSYSGLTRPSAGNWVTPLAIHPTNQQTLYGGWTGFYKSVNGGINWTLLSGTTITAALDDIAIAPSDTNYIYASRGAALYVSTDAGATWTTYAPGAGTISDICVHRTIPNRIYITTTSGSNQLRMSTDAGATFSIISTGLPAVAARSVAIENNTVNGLYVGMNTGVYYKNDTMSSWLNYTANLPAVAVNELEIQYSGNRIRVATYGRGVWDAPLYQQSLTLPVRWLSFTGKNETNLIHLNWTITGERPGTVYEIEKSRDGRRFSVIGTKNGNGLNADRYEFDDLQPFNGIQYYRIKEKSNGEMYYSRIIAITTQSKQESLLITPNPVRSGILHYSFINGNAEAYEINIVDMRGRLLGVDRQQDNIGMIPVSHLPAGSYLLVVKYSGGLVQKKFVISH